MLSVDSYFWLLDDVEAVELVRCRFGTVLYGVVTLLLLLLLLLLLVWSRGFEDLAASSTADMDTVELLLLLLLELVAVCELEFELELSLLHSATLRLLLITF